MGLVNTDAIVLRTYNLAEADRIVLCLTRNAGLVRAVAKGARRMKSRFGAALEPFTFIRLSFHEKENRELVSMSGAEILKSHFNLNSNLECVEALAEQGGSERELTRYFEIWLLRLAGLFPDLRVCAACGVALETSHETA